MTSRLGTGKSLTFFKVHVRTVGKNTYRTNTPSCIFEFLFVRKKKDIDVINDNDDAIAKMIADMRIGEHSSSVHHEKYTI